MLKFSQNEQQFGSQCEQNDVVSKKPYFKYQSFQGEKTSQKMTSSANSHQSNDFIFKSPGFRSELTIMIPTPKVHTFSSTSRTNNFTQNSINHHTVQSIRTQVTHTSQHNSSLQIYQQYIKTLEDQIASRQRQRIKLEKNYTEMRNDNQMLAREIHHQRNNCAMMDRKIQEIEMVNQQLVQEKARMENLSAEKEKGRQSVMIKIQDLERDLMGCRRQIHTMQMENQKIKQQFALKQTQVNQLQRLLAVNSNQYIVEAKHLQQQNQFLQLNIQELRYKLKESQIHKESLHREIIQTIRQKTTMIESIIIQKSHIQNRVKRQQQQIIHIKQQLQNRENIIKSLISNIEQIKFSSQQDRDNLNLRMSELHIDFSRIRKQNQTLKTQMVQKQSEMNQSSEMMRQRIDRLEKQQILSRELVQTLREENTRLQYQKQQLQKQLESMQKEHKKQQNIQIQQKSTMQIHLQQLEGLVQQRQTFVESLKGQVAQLRAELAQLKEKGEDNLEDRERKIQQLERQQQIMQEQLTGKIQLIVNQKQQQQNQHSRLIEQLHKNHSSQMTKQAHQLNLAASTKLIQMKNYYEQKVIQQWSRKCTRLQKQLQLEHQHFQQQKVLIIQSKSQQCKQLIDSLQITHENAYKRLEDHLNNQITQKIRQIKNIEQQTLLLQEKNQELENCLLKAREDVTKIQRFHLQQTLQLQQKNKTLLDGLNKKSTEQRTAFETQIDVINKQHNAKTKQFNEKLSIFQRQNCQLKQEIDKLKISLKVTEQTTCKTIFQLKQRIIKLQQQNSQMLSQITIKQKEVIERYQQLSQYEKKQCQQKINQTNQQKNTLQKQNAKLKTEISQTNSQKQQIEKYRDQLQKQKLSIQKECENIKTLVQDMQNQSKILIVKYQQAMNSFNKELQFIKDVNKFTPRQYKNQETQYLDKEKTQHVGRISLFEDYKIIQLNRKNTQQNNRNNDSNSYKSQIDKVKQGLELMAKMFKDKMLQVSNLQKLTKQQNIQINELKHQLLRQKNSFLNLSSRIQIQNKQNAKLTEQNRRIYQQTSQLQKQNNSIKTQLQNSQNQLKTSKFSLHQHLQICKAQQSFYHSQLESIGKKFEHHQKVIKNDQFQIQQLQQQLDQAQSKIKHLTQSHNEEISRLKKLNDSSLEKLQNLYKQQLDHLNLQTAERVNEMSAQEIKMKEKLKEKEKQISALKQKHEQSKQQYEKKILIIQQQTHLNFTANQFMLKRIKLLQADCQQKLSQISHLQETNTILRQNMITSINQKQQLREQIKSRGSRSSFKTINREKSTFSARKNSSESRFRMHGDNIRERLASKQMYRKRSGNDTGNISNMIQQQRQHAALLEIRREELRKKYLGRSNNTTKNRQKSHSGQGRKEFVRSGNKSVNSDTIKDIRVFGSRYESGNNLQTNNRDTKIMSSAQQVKRNYLNTQPKQEILSQSENRQIERTNNYMPYLPLANRQKPPQSYTFTLNNRLSQTQRPVSNYQQSHVVLDLKRLKERKNILTQHRELATKLKYQEVTNQGVLQKGENILVIQTDSNMPNNKMQQELLSPIHMYTCIDQISLITGKETINEVNSVNASNDQNQTDCLQKQELNQKNLN